jgi:ribosomal protein S27E
MSTFWMTSKRDSHCTECEGTIEEGERIVYDSDTYKAYCNSCGEEVAGQDPFTK